MSAAAAGVPIPTRPDLDAPAGDPQDESIAELVGRLVEDGRAFAERELDLLKAIAAHRAVRARRALVALLVGGFLMFVSLLALVFGSVLGLATLIHPFLAGLAIGVPLALGGYLLIRMGSAGVKTLGRDEAEADAIRRG